MAVEVPQGKPAGRGLLVRKAGSLGAARVPKVEALRKCRQYSTLLISATQVSTYPLVCVWVSAARTLRRMLVTVLNADPIVVGSV